MSKRNKMVVENATLYLFHANKCLAGTVRQTFIHVRLRGLEQLNLGIYS
jgi:hypothetical protein